MLYDPKQPSEVKISTPGWCIVSLCTAPLLPIPPKVTKGALGLWLPVGEHYLAFIIICNVAVIFAAQWRLRFPPFAQMGL